LSIHKKKSGKTETELTGEKYGQEFKLKFCLPPFAELKTHFVYIGPPQTGRFETTKGAYKTKPYFSKGFTITFSARVGDLGLPISVVSPSFTIVDEHNQQSPYVSV
jgi:hypothetical protein